jgi:hypothetical protein
MIPLKTLVLRSFSTHVYACKSSPPNLEGRRLRNPPMGLGVCFVVGGRGDLIRYLVNQEMPDEARLERGTWRVVEHGGYEEPNSYP